MTDVLLCSVPGVLVCILETLVLVANSLDCVVMVNAVKVWLVVVVVLLWVVYFFGVLISKLPKLLWVIVVLWVGCDGSVCVDVPVGAVCCLVAACFCTICSDC